MTHLIKQRPLLAQHGVEVEFHPIFLGGVNVGSGNKPPWTLPAKAKYGAYEMKRAIQHFGTIDLQAPPFFPILSIVVSRRLISNVLAPSCIWATQDLMCFDALVPSPSNSLPYALPSPPSTLPTKSPTY